MSIKAGNTYGNSMSFPRPGIGAVGSYQVAGVPFVTGTIAGALQIPDTEIRVSFPFVTRAITVLNLSTNAAIYVHYNSQDPGTAGSPNPGGSTGVISGSHYVPLDSDEDSLTMNIKCKEVFITTPPTNSDLGTPNADWRVFAELTHIGGGQMYQLTGSGLTDSAVDP